MRPRPGNDVFCFLSNLFIFCIYLRYFSRRTFIYLVMKLFVRSSYRIVISLGRQWATFWSCKSANILPWSVWMKRSFQHNMKWWMMIFTTLYWNEWFLIWIGHARRFKLYLVNLEKSSKSIKYRLHRLNRLKLNLFFCSDDTALMCVASRDGAQELVVAFFVTLLHKYITYLPT